MPNGAWLSKGAKYLPTAGEKGTPAILVNHDNRLYITMKVEGGKKYELEFEVKAANPNDFKEEFSLPEQSGNFFQTVAERGKDFCVMKKILIVSLFAAASFCMEAADPFFGVE